jgi:hypothetical protein
MNAPNNPLNDIVALSKLPEVAPHLCSEGRVRRWLRDRKKNGAEAAGAIYMKGGVAFASLSKLGAWLTQPDRTTRRTRKSK